MLKTVTHPAFEALRHQSIPALNLTAEEYRHRKTGALHYHLASDNPENVFLVALRTVPQDSTGVAHILEHTALCGSERYPVRDPFFLMLRRSLNTFMNALTSSDWTAYPFASQNRKDFDNLLQIYLDAVFFAKLEEQDFAQEGHRLEFAEAGNPDSPLVYKGVVYNEMKGAMSSVPSQLWQTLTKYLFPTTTYHHNSGGDPDCIPDLTHEQLVAFYRRHYHPGNAVFMTYGDIPAAEHHQRFEELALARFDSSVPPASIVDEKRYHAPIRVQEHYALEAGQDSRDKSHIVLGWLLGNSADLQSWLEAELLNGVLLDNSASPLRRALETTELGSAPSPLCGLEESNREMSFSCGLEGSNPDQLEAVESLILQTLEQVARDGVPQEQVEAVLHQLEFHQREIGGDSHPYGLQLVMSALDTAVHGGDPIAVLDLDPVIARLRENIRDPQYIRRLTRELLLDNRHRVSLVLAPDAELAGHREAAERSRLERIRDSLDEEQRRGILRRAEALAERQQEPQDESILPKVGLADIPADIPHVDPAYHRDQPLPVTGYECGTNGLVYQQALLELPALDERELSLLPCYSHIFTEVGVGDADYLATQSRQAATCGGFSARAEVRAAVDDEQRGHGYLVLSGKALQRNAAAQQQLIRETLERARFDETGRLRELVAQQRARRDMAITGNGHLLAMHAACAGMSPMARLTHRLAGLAGVRTLRELDNALRDDAQAEQFGKQLETLHRKLAGSRPQLLLVAEGEFREQLLRDTEQYWQGFAGQQSEPLRLPAVRERVAEAWIANTQVNFCARAYPTVPLEHPDAAALAVLGGFLRNGYLHRAIREQGGAYGGGASHDPNIAAFRFFSYRDPRLSETLEDFDRAIEWLLAGDHEDEQLEQAILGVIGSLDRPASPAGEARQDFHHRLFGRSPERRRDFRARVLAVTLADLRRVAEHYLQPQQASTAVITSAGGAEQYRDYLDGLGMERCEL